MRIGGRGAQGGGGRAQIGGKGGGLVTMSD
jgi:hypothetical protein